MFQAWRSHFPDAVTPPQALPSVLQDPRAPLTPRLPQARLSSQGAMTLLTSQLPPILPPQASGRGSVATPQQPPESVPQEDDGRDRLQQELRL